MLPVIQIGPLALQTPGLIMILSAWLGLTLAETRLKIPRNNQAGISTDVLYNLAFIALAAGVVGARLGFVVRYPQIFHTTPLSLFSLDPSLLDPWGAALAGSLAVWIYGTRLKLPLWETLDLFVPFFSVIGIGFGLSHLASGAAFGAPSNLPWAIDLWGARRQPSQVYEIAAACVILVVVIRDKAAFQKPGVRLFLFIILSATARLFLEAFRGDSTLIGRTLFSVSLRQAQLAAWVILALGLWGLGKRLSKNSQEGRP